MKRTGRAAFRGLLRLAAGSFARPERPGMDAP